MNIKVGSRTVEVFGPGEVEAEAKRKAAAVCDDLVCQMLAKVRQKMVAGKLPSFRILWPPQNLKGLPSIVDRTVAALKSAGWADIDHQTHVESQAVKITFTLREA